MKKILSFLIGILLGCLLCIIWYVIIHKGSDNDIRGKIKIKTGEVLVVEEEKKEKKIKLSKDKGGNMDNKFDLEVDTSITKYVGKGVPFKKKDYIPNDLVILKNNKYLEIYTKGRIPEQKLRKEAVDNLNELAKAFFEKFKKPIYVYSAYRSYSYQKNSIGQSCKDEGFCAVEGESEHQGGLALDLWEASSEKKFLKKYGEYYKWLKNNAHVYGFHQSYQNGIKKDGYYIEPWHWRYLGKDLATLLHEKQETFVQYFKNKK